MLDVLRSLNQALESGVPFVYCSVVETRGSTPQKGGASMVVFADGRQIGTLGGGCVEAEVKRQALHSLSQTETGEPKVHSFCLDDNYGWDDGLICGGRMNILADPLSLRVRLADEAALNGRSANPIREYYRRFVERVEAGLGCTEAVVVAEDAGVAIGSRYLFDETGDMLDRLGPPAPVQVHQNLADLGRRPRPYHARGVAYLPVLPRITLLIVGGGHVGQAVAKLAAEVDFDIWVLDDREMYVSSERFPMARRRLVGDIGAELRTLVRKDVVSNVYALIVTRGHAHDEEALFHLAGSGASYVGMIGSKRKIKLIYEDLVARGIPREALAKVHAPLGFHIGSQTVPEIAVSIVAELIACRNLGATIPAARLHVHA